MPAASPAQINFILSLSAARSVALAANPGIAAMPTDTMAQASALITVLKALPVDPDPSVPEVVAKAQKSGVNRYSGVCIMCRNTVEAGAGFYFSVPNGKYANHHKVGECPAPAEVKPEAVVTEGFWKYGEASYVKVYRTQNGYLGGKVLTGKGEWLYSHGIIPVLRRSEPVQVTPQDVLAEVCIRKFGAPLGSEELRIKAAEYGTAHASCMFCARPLTDERSDPSLGGVGYGPECASKYGLPWGNVNITK